MLISRAVAEIGRQGYPQTEFVILDVEPALERAAFEHWAADLIGKTADQLVSQHERMQPHVGKGLSVHKVFCFVEPESGPVRFDISVV